MTIGFNELGKHGRLGNQMFQYAALVGIAKQCGFDFRIPDHSNATRFDYHNGSTTISEYHQLQHYLLFLRYLHQHKSRYYKHHPL